MERLPRRQMLPPPAGASALQAVKTALVAESPPVFEGEEDCVEVMWFVLLGSSREAAVATGAASSEEGGQRSAQAG